MLLLVPILVILLVAVAILWWGWSAHREAFGPEYDRFRSVEHGMAEDVVIDRLGQPTYAYSRDAAPSDYFVEGYAHPDHEISHKVLIYVGTEPIAYIFIDASGRVEEVFVGGS